MSFFYNILALFFIIVGLIIGFLLLYFIIVSTINFFKHENSWNDKQKPFNFKEYFFYCVVPPILEHRYIKLVDFIKWVVVDTIRGKDRLRLWGIWAFTGYYGQGKTMGCVQYAKYLQEKYPHRGIKIYSNIEVAGQVKKIKNWEELLDLPPNSIMIYDESQADWSCNIGTNSFPEDFLRRITQCRKKQFAMFMTSLRYNRMNINLRESINFVVECKNLFDMDRWFRYDFYRAEDYEMYYDNKFKLKTHKYIDLSFVISDDDYCLYDTSEEVESIKKDDVKLNKKDVVTLGSELKSFRNEIYKKLEIEINNIKKIIKK